MGLARQPIAHPCSHRLACRKCYLFRRNIRYGTIFAYSKLCGTAKTETGTDAELGRWVLTP